MSESSMCMKNFLKQIRTEEAEEKNEKKRDNKYPNHFHTKKNHTHSFSYRSFLQRQPWNFCISFFSITAAIICVLVAHLLASLFMKN